MSIDWARTTKLLLRGLIVAAVLVLVAYLFSISSTILFFIIVALLGLFTKRKQLSSTFRRSRVMIGVVVGTALFFSFILWYVNGDTSSALGLVVIAVFTVVLSLGLYD
jgi:hypothetical protein